MKGSVAGKYVDSQDIYALKKLGPGEYMKYINESGETAWIGVCPIQTDEKLYVYLNDFGPVFKGGKLSCEKKIYAGAVGAGKYLWTGYLSNGQWRW